MSIISTWNSFRYKSLAAGHGTWPMRAPRSHLATSPLLGRCPGRHHVTCPVTTHYALRSVSDIKICRPSVPLSPSPLPLSLASPPRQMILFAATPARRARVRHCGLKKKTNKPLREPNAFWLLCYNQNPYVSFRLAESYATGTGVGIG